MAPIASTHPSRLANLPPEPKQPLKPSSSTKKAKHKHPRLPSTATASSSATSTSSSATTGALRNAIRNLERLLARGADRLPVTVRQDKERELAKLTSDLEDRRKALRGGKSNGSGSGSRRRNNDNNGAGDDDEDGDSAAKLRLNKNNNNNSSYKKRRNKEEHKVISKYHGVRFYERQKATRRLKKLRSVEKDRGSGGEGAEELARSIHEAQVDLNYTLFSPLAEKYVSLFVKGDTTDGDGETARKKRREGKPAWWFAVEKATLLGPEALDDVREGRWDGEGEWVPRPKVVEEEDEEEEDEEDSPTPNKVANVEGTAHRVEEPRDARKIAKKDSSAKHGLRNGKDSSRQQDESPVQAGDESDDSGGGFFDF